MTRTYGFHFRAKKEDPTRCIESVCGRERWDEPTQCSRKRGHGPEGLHCKQHDPAAKAARLKASTEAWRARYERETRPFRKAQRFEWALREIAGGRPHVDAKTFAANVLAEFE